MFKRKKLCRIACLVCALLLMFPATAFASSADPAETGGGGTEASSEQMSESTAEPVTDPAGESEPETEPEPMAISEVLSGTTGEISWTYDPGTTTLTLSGSGASANYSSPTGQPWAEIQTEITSVVVEEGVTTLGNRLFYGASNLTEIHFPETSLISIGEGTFRACTSLEAVTFPASLKTLARVSFYGDSALKSVVFQGNNITEINDQTFSGAHLTTITIPASVVKLNAKGAKGAFNNALDAEVKISYGGKVSQWEALLETDGASELCSAAITVNCEDGTFTYGASPIPESSLTYTIKDGVLTIYGSGNMPDYGEMNPAPWASEAGAIKTVMLSGSITKIGSNAFSGFTALEEVNWLGRQSAWDTLKANSGEGNELLFGCVSVTTFSEGTLGEMTWTLDDDGTLTIYGSGEMPDISSADAQPWRQSATEIKAVVISEGITSVGKYAFSMLGNLSEVTLPGSVEVIGTYAFYSDGSLESLTLPEGLRCIGSNAFETCGRLRRVDLPSTVEFIDYKAFNGTGSLREVNYAGSELQWNRVAISVQARGNINLFTYVTFRRTAKVWEQADDVRETDWYAEAVQYLIEFGAFGDVTGSFGPDDPISRDTVTEILYTMAGSPGMYASAQEWGDVTGVLKLGDLTDFTLAELCALLYRTAAYNGHSVAVTAQASFDTEKLSEEQALAVAWCESRGYLDDLKANEPEITAQTVLGRGEASSILKAYLESAESTADFYDALIAEVKEALAQGGNGTMYILTPKMFENSEKNPSKCGDCTLIVFPQGTTMLVDGGNSHCSDQVIRMLKALGLTSLDYFALSHPHGDHVGGMTAVANYLYGEGGAIGHYWRPDFSFSSEIGFTELMRQKSVDIQNVLAGDTYEIDGVTIDIYNPTQDALDSLKGVSASDELVNNISALMKLTYGTSTYLTGGDIYTAREKELIQSFNSLLASDVIKTNHHGGYTSNSEGWMDTVNPLIAVSDADDNGNSSLMRMLAKRGTAYYASGLDGLILITMGPNRDYTVRSQYDGTMRGDYRGEYGMRTGSYSQSEPDQREKETIDGPEDNPGEESGENPGQTNPGTVPPPATGEITSPQTGDLSGGISLLVLSLTSMGVLSAVSLSETLRRKNKRR